MSAFFSASETSLFSISDTKLYSLEKKGKKRATSTRNLKKKSEYVIGTILICNNLINIFASAIATKIALDFSQTHGIIIATITMTVLLVLFAEILPKIYAISHSENLSLFITPVISLACKIFSPVLYLIFKIIPVQGIRDSVIANLTASEEIRGTIELHHSTGKVIKEDKDMLGSILDLEEATVESVMVHRKNVFLVDLDQDNKTIVDQLIKSELSRVPVYCDDNKDNIIGVIHMKDLYRNIHYSTKKLEEINMKTIMQEAWFVLETTNLKQQLLNFKKKKQHFAIVVDEYGTIKGILTLEDILEEIVGEINDEHDETVQVLQKSTKEKAYIVDGTTTIRDINKELSWSLPDLEEVHTIAGLLIEQLGDIPKRKKIYEYFGIKFKVLEKTKHQIIKLELSKVNPNK